MCCSYFNDFIRQNQLIKVRLLWKKEKENIINCLKTNYREIIIYPMNFANNFVQKEINKYIFFINSKEY